MAMVIPNQETPTSCMDRNYIQYFLLSEHLNLCSAVLTENPHSLFSDYCTYSTRSSELFSSLRFLNDQNPTDNGANKLIT